MDKFKLISITIVLILLSGAIIYYENLKLLIDSKKSAYIIFDSEKDKIGYIDWSKYGNLFPENTNNLDSDELLFELNTSQLKSYDSILKRYKKYPQKYIQNHNYKEEYGIHLYHDENIEFKYNKNDITIIKPDKIKGLNVLPLDSIINIFFPEKNIKTSNSSEKENIFNLKRNIYILKIDKNSGKVLCIPVNPTLVLFD